jgi:hypothetical protein
MQTQRKTHWLPVSLFVMAVAIVVAGYLLSDSVRVAGESQVHAQQETTAAVNSASVANARQAFQAEQNQAVRDQVLQSQLALQAAQARQQAWQDQLQANQRAIESRL